MASWKESQFRGRGRLFYRCCECRKFVDTLAHSHLPKLRMPLAHIHKAMEHYFQGAVPPTVEELGHRLGHDAASSTCQTPELLDARRSQMRGMDAERPRSLRTAIAAPHPKKKMSKTCSISCLCNHVFAVAYHVACRHFGSGRHIAETLESSGILSPAVPPALRSCQAWRAIHQPLRSWHPGDTTQTSPVCFSKIEICTWGPKL